MAIEVIPIPDELFMRAASKRVPGAPKPKFWPSFAWSVRRIDRGSRFGVVVSGLSARRLTQGQSEP